MKKRCFYLDLLRIWAILCVVLLHCITGIMSSPALRGSASWAVSIVLNELVRTGVPLFLMISGYLMLSAEKSAEIGWFYKKRLPRLLIPLGVWNIIYYVFYAFRGGDTSVGGFFAAVANNGTAYHMWFVYTLFAIYLITPFLKKLADTLTDRQLLLLITIILFPCTLRPFINTVAPVYIYLFEPLAEGYLGYFLLGYLLGRAKLSFRVRIPIIIGGMVGLFIGVFANFNSPDTLPFNQGYSINHYLLAAALFCMARTLDEHINIPCLVCKAFAKISDISFGIYWLHVIAITLFCENIAVDTSPIVSSTICFVAVTVICGAIMLAVSYVKPLKKLIM